MNMTDEGLLTLAALSVGYTVYGWTDWNPLESLEDAKALRHKLCMTTGYTADYAYAKCTVYGKEIRVQEPFTEGKRKALRRAITKVAAKVRLHQNAEKARIIFKDLVEEDRR